MNFAKILTLFLLAHLLALSPGVLAASPCNQADLPILQSADKNHNGVIDDDEANDAVTAWVKDNATADQATQAIVKAWSTSCTITLDPNAPKDDQPPFGTEGRGDFDKNGIINEADCTALAKLLDNPNALNPDLDVDANNKVDFGDVQRCLTEINGVARPQGAGSPGDSPSDNPGPGGIKPVANEYLIQKLPTLASSQASKDQTVKLEHTGDLDLTLIANGDLCPGAASGSATLKRDGKTIRSFEIKDSVFGQQSKFATLAVKQGDTLIMSAKRDGLECWSSTEIRATLKYPANPAKPALYIGEPIDYPTLELGNLKDVSVDLNESPDDQFEICAVNWGDATSATLVKFGEEGTHNLYQKYPPEGVFTIEYGCSIKNSVEHVQIERVLNLQSSEVNKDGGKDNLGYEPGPSDGSVTKNGPPSDGVRSKDAGNKNKIEYSVSHTKGTISDNYKIILRATGSRSIVYNPKSKSGFPALNFVMIENIGHREIFRGLNELVPGKEYELTISPVLYLQAQKGLTNGMNIDFYYMYKDGGDGNTDFHGATEIYERKVFEIEFLEPSDENKSMVYPVNIMMGVQEITQGTGEYKALIDESPDEIIDWCYIGWSGVPDNKVPVKPTSGVHEELHYYDKSIYLSSAQRKIYYWCTDRNGKTIGMTYAEALINSDKSKDAKGLSCRDDINCTQNTKCLPVKPGLQHETGKACCPLGTGFDGKACSAVVGASMRILVADVALDGTVIVELSESPDEQIKSCGINWGDAYNDFAPVTMSAKDIHQLTHQYKTSGAFPITYQCDLRNGELLQKVATARVDKGLDAELQVFDIVLVGSSDNTPDPTSVHNFVYKDSPFREVTSPYDEGVVRIHTIPASQCQIPSDCGALDGACFPHLQLCVNNSEFKNVVDLKLGFVDSIEVFGFRALGVGLFPVRATIVTNEAGKKVVSHEIGHAYDLMHIDCPESGYGVPAGACIGVNAKDCQRPPSLKAQDIMSYCDYGQFGPVAYKHLENEFYRFVAQ